MILGMSLAGFVALAQQKALRENSLQLNIKPQNKLEISYLPAAYPRDFMLLIYDSTGKTVFLENQFRAREPYTRLVDLDKYNASKYFVQLKDDEGELKRTIILK
jgi:hypothetical protein